MRCQARLGDMKRSRNIVGAAMLAVLQVALHAQQPQAQQTPPGKIDVSRLGPQPGEKVPDFNLRDQYGVTRNLNSIMGPKGAMLVFIRSADWCPYCKTQLVELQSQLKEIEGRGLGIASISYDSVQVVAAF